jgi:2-polyprenyl-6-methoxyphenol hydroxylase-like FAD-dependent oxidoreductase
MAVIRSNAVPKATDVLIVGAGPTGLALACRLAQAGVDHVLIDAAAAGANSSRAAVVHARTLEVLDGIGATDSLLREGRIISDFALMDRDRTLLRVDFSALPSAYPYALMLPQQHTEVLLSDLLARSGSSVRRSWRALDVDAQREAVTVRLEREGDREGRAETREPASIVARYVVGCDGMHSTVREACGIPFVGESYPESFVLADVRMRWPLPDTQAQVFVCEAGVMVVAPLPGNQFRLVATLDPAPEQPTLADLRELLRQRGPSAATAVEEVVWSGRFRVQRKMAERYRRGRVLLAGDAAHVHSPAGGQGMNIGIQDALALAEHLIGALASQAPPAELDAYERERRPAAAAVLRLTDRLMRVALLRSPVFRLLRNRTVSALGRSERFRQRLALELSELAD